MARNTPVKYVEFGNGEEWGCLLQLPSRIFFFRHCKTEPNEKVTEFAASFRFRGGEAIFAQEKLSG